jgi:hypothetical protein
MAPAQLTLFAEFHRLLQNLVCAVRMKDWAQLTAGIRKLRGPGFCMERRGAAQGKNNKMQNRYQTLFQMMCPHTGMMSQLF